LLKQGRFFFFFQHFAFSSAMTRSLVLTPEAFDSVLANLEDAFDELEVAQGHAMHLEAELHLLEHLEVACHFMKRIVQLRGGCSELEKVFGQDCVRISRIRAVLEAARFSDISAADERFVTCFSTCESVEKILQDQGLGCVLRRAQHYQRQVLCNRSASLSLDSPRFDVMDLPSARESAPDVTVIDLLSERESFLKGTVQTQQPQATLVEGDVQIASVSISAEEEFAYSRYGLSKSTIQAKAFETQCMESALLVSSPQLLLETIHHPETGLAESAHQPAPFLSRRRHDCKWEDKVLVNPPVISCTVWPAGVQFVSINLY